MPDMERHIDCTTYRQVIYILRRFLEELAVSVSGRGKGKPADQLRDELKSMRCGPTVLNPASVISRVPYVKVMIIRTVIG